jgi:predicted RNase H-like HicB family nuclease
MKTAYIAAVEHETGTSYSVEFPDLPGCFSAAATPLEIAPMAGEAAEAWIAVALERGQAVPQPSALDQLRGRQELAGRALMFIEVDIPESRAIRLNITLPETILAEVDAYARRTRQPRSTVLAKAATSYLRRAPRHPAN